MDGMTVLSLQSPLRGAKFGPKAYEYSVPWTKIIPPRQVPRLHQQSTSVLQLKAWQNQNHSAWNGRLPDHAQRRPARQAVDQDIGNDIARTQGSWGINTLLIPWLSLESIEINSISKEELFGRGKKTSDRAIEPTENQ
jgi:hypothetical protein